MVICNNKKLINIILNILIIFLFIDLSYADANFKELERKSVSYLDFFLLKFENNLINRSHVLRAQFLAKRVQYSELGIQVDFDNKKKKISTEIYAVMDKNRYSKKKYKQKLSDCNQIRNLILYKRYGYKFLTQKRDPSLSTDLMINIFKEVFLDNLDFNEEEKEFLLNNMIIKVTIYHPVYKKELSCSGKINDYELN